MFTGGSTIRWTVRVRKFTAEGGADTLHKSFSQSCSVTLARALNKKKKFVDKFDGKLLWEKNRAPLAGHPSSATVGTSSSASVTQDPTISTLLVSTAIFCCCWSQLVFFNGRKFKLFQGSTTFQQSGRRGEHTRLAKTGALVRGPFRGVALTVIKRLSEVDGRSTPDSTRLFAFAATRRALYFLEVSSWEKKFFLIRQQIQKSYVCPRANLPTANPTLFRVALFELDWFFMLTT